MSEGVVSPLEYARAISAVEARSALSASGAAACTSTRVPTVDGELVSLGPAW